MQNIAAKAQLSQGLTIMAVPLINPIKVDRQNTLGRVLAFQFTVAVKWGSAFIRFAHYPL